MSFCLRSYHRLPLYGRSVAFLAGKLALSTMATPQPGPATAPPLPAANPANGHGSQNSTPVVGAKRPHSNERKPYRKKQTKRQRGIKEGSNEEVLRADILALYNNTKLWPARRAVDEATAPDADSPELNAEDPELDAIASGRVQLPEPGTELDLRVIDVSSTGDGLAIQPDGPKHIYVVPFSVAGDLVRAKIYRHLLAEHHSIADFIRVVAPAPQRDDTLIKCRYFAACGGCQLQMLPYQDQLAYKKTVVQRAFAHFSGLAPELVPAVGETMPSPLQYGYRTKLTPHFDGPPGFQRRRRGQGPRAAFEACPDVGFMRKGQRKVMDIEDCPIGTEVVLKGLTRERERIKRQFGDYSRGATILLRESTERFPAGSTDVPAEIPKDVVRVDGNGHVDIKTCVTDNNAIASEFVGNYRFTNQAGFFFQNNNSILPVVTDYIRERILGASASAAQSLSESATKQLEPDRDPAASKQETSTPATAQATSLATSPPKTIKYLIDAYSGSGLFTITLSPLFQGSIGIDVSENSIQSARHNAALNNLPSERVSFLAADAAHLFASVKYDPDETAVVIDPPRKGCDAPFLAQLRAFGPRRVVYVSCNVHTQARDVGVLVRGEGTGARYAIESVRGFDFFPQTSHVEGVAVLDRVD